MATKPYTEIPQGSQIKIIKWTGLSNGDTGLPYPVFRQTERSVQVYGTFGVGGKVIIEGSNDDSSSITYATLKDPQGNILEISVPKIEKISECSLVIRPKVVGTSLTNLTVVMIFTSSTI